MARMLSPSWTRAARVFFTGWPTLRFVAAQLSTFRSQRQILDGFHTFFTVWRLCAPCYSPAMSSVPMEALDHGLFKGYDPGDFYDEMFSARGVPRLHYAQLFQKLAGMEPAQFEERRKLA